MYLKKCIYGKRSDLEAIPPVGPTLFNICFFLFFFFVVVLFVLYPIYVFDCLNKTTSNIISSITCILKCNPIRTQPFFIL